MSEAPTAYPLAWPFGWKRTSASQRKPTRFRTGSRDLTTADARKRISYEAEKLGARALIISTNMELRADGMLRANAPAPNDPGVAFYFRLAGKPIVLACDRWSSVAGNIAAIAAHIEAMRGQDRWGVGSIQQAFAGYTALPSPMVPDDWRAVLLDPKSLEIAEHVYRDRMKSAHPDAGGSHANAAALNAAIAAARKHFGVRT